MLRRASVPLVKLDHNAVADKVVEYENKCTQNFGFSPFLLRRNYWPQCPSPSEETVGLGVFDYLGTLLAVTISNFKKKGILFTQFPLFMSQIEP